MQLSKLFLDLTTMGRFFAAVSNNDGHFSDLSINAEDQKKFLGAMRLAEIKNPWFTRTNIQNAFKAWSEQLKPSELERWVGDRQFKSSGKTIAIIAAGNIPLVALHDLLAVLVSGNRALIKLSTDDEVLIKLVADYLYDRDDEYRDLIQIATGPLKNFDAVIATGSDNTSRYFEYYFGKHPNVIRKNRTSLAVLTGKESTEELQALGRDIFTYFGMGCRNVSHLLVPVGYKFDQFFESMFEYGDVVNHNKYVNNYDYHKAIYLLERLPFLDNNFLMIREHESLFSPLATIHYSFYENKDDITNYILDNSQKIQCVVGQDYIPFGEAQCPTLNDYADGVNTLDFLQSL